MECLLFLFRHGETDWNRAGRLQGHTDTPLNATGLAQAEALTERLRPHGLDAVVSSDLARAWTTGQIVAEGLGIPLIREPGLREAQIGEAEPLAVGARRGGGRDRRLLRRSSHAGGLRAADPRPRIGKGGAVACTEGRDP